MTQTGKSLDATRLFRMVAEEALRDGKVDEREKEILYTFARFLRLERERASALFRETAQSLKGSAADVSPMDPVGLYRRIRREVVEAGGAGADDPLLRGLRSLLGIGEDMHRRIEAEDDPAAAAPPGYWRDLSLTWEKEIADALAAGDLSGVQDRLDRLRHAPLLAGPEVAPARLRALLALVHHDSLRSRTSEAWRGCQEMKQLLLEHSVEGGWADYAGSLATFLLMGVSRGVPQRTRLVAALDALEEAADEPAGGLAARRRWASALGAAGILLVESSDPRRLARCLDRVERFTAAELEDEPLCLELLESLATLMATLAGQADDPGEEGDIDDSWGHQRPFRGVDRDGLAVRVVTSARSLLGRTEGRASLKIARDRLASVIDPVAVSL